jgi:hypothetical protein
VIFKDLNSVMAFDFHGMCGLHQDWKQRELWFRLVACEKIKSCCQIQIDLFCRYTPLKKIENMPAPLAYDPVKCNSCGAVLNPFVYVCLLSMFIFFKLFYLTVKLISTQNFGHVLFVQHVIIFLLIMLKIFPLRVYQQS